MVDWTVLIMMSLLNIVNDMYKQKSEIAKLQEVAKNSIQEQYKSANYYYGRVERIVKSLIIYMILIFMIYIHQSIETNIINWCFFILNALNFAFIIRGTKNLAYIT